MMTSPCACALLRGVAIFATSLLVLADSQAQHNTGTDAPTNVRVLDKVDLGVKLDLRRYNVETIVIQDDATVSEFNVGSKTVYFMEGVTIRTEKFMSTGASLIASTCQGNADSGVQVIISGESSITRSFSLVGVELVNEGVMTIHPLTEVLFNTTGEACVKDIGADCTMHEDCHQSIAPSSGVVRTRLTNNNVLIIKFGATLRHGELFLPQEVFAESQKAPTAITLYNGAKGHITLEGWHRPEEDGPHFEYTRKEDLHLFAVDNAATPCGISFEREQQIPWNIPVGEMHIPDALVILLSLYVVNEPGSTIIVNATVFLHALYTHGSDALLKVGSVRQSRRTNITVSDGSALHIQNGVILHADIVVGRQGKFVVLNGDALTIGTSTVGLNMGTFALCASNVAVEDASPLVITSTNMQASGNVSRFIIADRSNLTLTNSKITVERYVRTELLKGAIVSSEYSDPQATVSTVDLSCHVAWRVGGVVVRQANTDYAPSGGETEIATPAPVGISNALNTNPSAKPLLMIIRNDAALTGSKTYRSERGIVPPTFMELQVSSTSLLLYDTSSNGTECDTALQLMYYLHIDQSSVYISGCVLLRGGGRWNQPHYSAVHSLGPAQLLLSGDHSLFAASNWETDIRATSGAVITCNKAPSVHGHLTLEQGSKLNLVSGSSLFVTRTLVTAHGSMIDIQSYSSYRGAPAIRAFDAILSGEVKAPLELTSCTHLIRVRGTASFPPPGLQLTCPREVYPERSGQYLPLVSWGHPQHDVAVDSFSIAGGCSGIGVEVEPVLVGNAFLMQLNVRRTWRSAMLPVVAGGVFLASLVAVVVTFSNKKGDGKGAVVSFFSGLVMKPPVQLCLRWDEARLFLPNIVVSVVILIESFWLFCVAFHPIAQWPAGMSGMQGFAGKIFFMHVHNAAFYLPFGFAVFFVWLWLFLWVPMLGVGRPGGGYVDCGADRPSGFSLLKHGKYHLGNLVSSIERQGHRNDVFYVMHRSLCASANFLYIPIIQVLLRPLSCMREPATDQMVMAADDTVRCWKGSHNVMLAFSAASTIIFFFLVFHSGSGLSVPFGHPPYRHDLDIRHKRSFEATRVLLLQAQGLVLAVFHADMSLLLPCSFAIQSLYFLAALFGNPCIYYNVNRFRVLLHSVALWAVVLAFAVGAQIGPNELPCEDQSGWLIAALFLGIVILGGVHECVRKAPCKKAPQVDDLSTRATVKQDSLKKLRGEISDLRRKQYKGDLEQRLQGVDGISERLRLDVLQIQYHKDLGDFRSLKDTYAMPYYLGTTNAPYFDRICTPALPPDTAEMESIAAEARVSLEADTIFEGWVRGELLGRGSFGSVYTGVLRGGQLIAVKVIDIPVVGSDGVIEEVMAVKKEVEFLKKLRHPNVIEYKAFFLDERNHCINIFMEYAVGGSLTGLVKKCRERLSEDVVKHYIRQILQGLAFLHGKGVIHRDIKGENVLLDAEGRVKLADFGCAKDVSSKTKAAGTCIGTPYWMAPEVIKNNGYNAKADVWSVGCTTIEVLNGGKPPWKQFDSVFMAMYHVSHSGETPNNCPPGLSDSCRDFIKRCCERDPEPRPEASDLLSHEWITETSASGPSYVGSEPHSPTGIDTLRDVSTEYIQRWIARGQPGDPAMPDPCEITLFSDVPMATEVFGCPPSEPHPDSRTGELTRADRVPLGPAATLAPALLTPSNQARQMESPPW